MQQHELLFQGAESRVYAATFFGREAVIKERFIKKYRHPRLNDSLIKQRLKWEARNLLKLKLNGICCPYVYFVDVNRGLIGMERIEGETVKQFLSERTRLLNINNQIRSDKDNIDLENRNRAYSDVAKQVGETIAKMHALDLIHGDLTTSNMIITPDGHLCIIDLGLSFQSTLAEDKAVDLYVFERGVLCSHTECADEFNNMVLSCYCTDKASQLVHNRLDKVRLRGRKRLAFG